MANFDTIKTAIDANINTNGKQEITGGKMNSILHQMVDATDEQLTELESKTNEIPHPEFVENCPFIVEIYITEEGKKKDLKTVHIVYNTDENKEVSFSNTLMDSYVARTYPIDGTSILELRSFTNPLSTTILGYALVDFGQPSAKGTILKQLTDAAYNLDFSPSIKTYLSGKQAEEEKQSSFEPILYAKNVWDDNLINKAIANGNYELGKYIGQGGGYADAPQAFANIFACSDYVPVKKGDVIKGRLVYLDEAPQPAVGAFYDAEKNLISSFYSDGFDTSEYTLIAPENAAFIRFTIILNIRQNYLCINPKVEFANRAKGRAINYLGDSITRGAFTDGIAQWYANVVAAITKSTSNNYGESGTLLGGDASGAFWKRLSEDVDMNADALIVFGGTNDYWSKNVLGELKSSNTLETCGAVNYIIDYWQTNCPKKPIAFILPFNQYWNGADCETDYGYGTLRDYCNAIKAICERKGVPVLDLFAESGMNIAFNEIHRNLYSVDGVHPNVEGHYVVARKIADFLDKLFVA